MTRPTSRSPRAMPDGRERAARTGSRVRAGTPPSGKARDGPASRCPRRCRRCRSIFHANHPEPVTVRTLVTTVTHHLGLPLPQGDITADQAHDRFRTRHDPTLRRRLSLLTQDHCFDSVPLWRHLGLEPGPVFADAFPATASWYQAHLSAPPAAAP
ncbi:hypothetical protein [Streptomyces naphthomycinicus]|uniref:hypothetical protein n=1 Tax=Streptomyces naphthomycinicus TaxID=2872625 RepID=UPI001CED0059|nr:hypothetical protein [Streptomyces sp. TML10]